MIGEGTYAATIVLNQLGEDPLTEVLDLIPVRIMTIKAASEAHRLGDFG
jgi:hypothetical protein